MEPTEPSDQSLQTQLGELNEKVRFYVGRLWQLPFVYLTVTGVFFLNASSSKAYGLIAVLLISLGILSIIAIYNIHKRVNEIVEDITEVEAALSLKRTVVRWTLAMTGPYYAMLVIGVVVNIAAPFWT